MPDIVKSDSVNDMLEAALKAKPKEQLKALIKVAVIQSIAINELRGQLIEAANVMKELTQEMKTANQINDSSFRHVKARAPFVSERERKSLEENEDRKPKSSGVRFH